MGQWGSDIHNEATKEWAMYVGFSEKSSNKIGYFDDLVDKGSTSPWPIIGDQSFHFNRNIWGGEDSRLTHFKKYLDKAKGQCYSKGNIFTNRDDPKESVYYLGMALHPLQDWVAHGDFGLFNTGNIWVPHNYYSPQKELGSLMDRAMAVDDPKLDSTGPNGRAAGNAIKTRFSTVGLTDWAYFKPGRQRYNLTKKLTTDALKDFKTHIKNNEKACRCYYFYTSDIVEVL